jgi:hypothetical protein
MTKQTWTDERTAQLENLVDKDTEVTQAEVHGIAVELDTTARSIGSKLRKMGYDVEKASATASRKWSDEEEDALREFLGQNNKSYTYAEIAAVFAEGKFTAKAIQGEVLSMEMTGNVKPAEKVEAVRSYTEDQEAQFLTLAEGGATIDVIAAALGKSEASVRGKALSFIRTIEGFTMPKQGESKATAKVDPLDALGDRIADMTVAEIAAEIDKTERGVKTSLTRRSLTCKDYDGAKKAAKNAEKVA